MKYSEQNSTRQIQSQKLKSWSWGAMRRGPLPTVAFLAAIVAIGGLSGCVGYTGAKTGTGKAGVLSGNSATVAFGNVGMGKTAMQSLTVTNTGTAAVNVSSSSIAGAGYTVASGSPSGTKRNRSDCVRATSDRQCNGQFHGYERRFKFTS